MKKVVLVLCAVFMLFACGKKEVKPASVESRTSLEAFALAETIRTAFVTNDKETLRLDSTPEGYKDITANTKNFDSVELTFTPRWVDIDGADVTLNVAWKSAWTVAGKKTEDRGMAVFQLEGKPLKVSKILRGNPFIVPAQ